MASENSTNQPSLSIIIPANNESDYIEACLQRLLVQDQRCPHAEIIVSANACTDDTALKAKGFTDSFRTRGWSLVVIDSDQSGKLGALNRAEKAARAPALAFLDADVECDAELIGQLSQALDSAAPRYATGTFTLLPAKSLISRLYGKFWMQLPFMKSPAVGAGLFAVNASGRQRWTNFPDIISDDTFVRLNFTPEERIEVSARYHWPLVEGFSQLVRVRRRQDAGVKELQRLYPDLFANEEKPEGSIVILGLQMPLAFSVYIAVQLAVRFRKKNATWARGR